MVITFVVQKTEAMALALLSLTAGLQADKILL